MQIGKGRKRMAIVLFSLKKPPQLSKALSQVKLRTITNWCWLIFKNYNLVIKMNNVAHPIMKLSIRKKRNTKQKLARIEEQKGFPSQ